MREPKQSPGWRSWLATVPAIGVALQPRLTRQGSKGVSGAPTGTLYQIGSIQKEK